MKKINGKTIKITKAGYLYIDGKKVTPKRCHPLNQAAIQETVNDSDITHYVFSWIWDHYTMC